jgi:hypothetical protein
MFSWALREEYKMQRSKTGLERKLNDLILAETIETDFFRGEYNERTNRVRVCFTPLFEDEPPLFAIREVHSAITCIRGRVIDESIGRFELQICSVYENEYAEIGIILSEFEKLVLIYKEMCQYRDYDADDFFYYRFSDSSRAFIRFKFSSFESVEHWKPVNYWELITQDKKEMSNSGANLKEKNTLLNIIYEIDENIQNGMEFRCIKKSKYENTYKKTVLELYESGNLTPEIEDRLMSVMKMLLRNMYSPQKENDKMETEATVRMLEDMAGLDGLAESDFQIK